MSGTSRMSQSHGCGLDHKDSYTSPMRFRFSLEGGTSVSSFQQTITPGPGGNSLFIDPSN